MSGRSRMARMLAEVTDDSPAGAESLPAGPYYAAWLYSTGRTRANEHEIPCRDDSHLWERSQVEPERLSHVDPDGARRQLYRDAGLTAEEVEALEHQRRGDRSNAQIAIEMCLSLAALERRVTSARRKLAARRKAMRAR